MRIAVAADHAGFPLKALVIGVVESEGHEAIDLGTFSTDPVDYPDYAEKAGRAIQEGRADRAVVLCGSGVGADIAANKLKGIRAALCHDNYSAHQCVEHDNANVLSLGARVIGSDVAEELVATFLRAEFSGAERHVRRLAKVDALEASG